MINRVGNCPNPGCNKSWDGGDIKEEVAKMDVYMFRSAEEIEEIAKNHYGWTPENPKHFSLAIHHSDPSNDIDALECPFCRSVYETETGLFYGTLMNMYKEKTKQIEDETTGEESGRLSDE